MPDSDRRPVPMEERRAYYRYRRRRAWADARAYTREKGVWAGLGYAVTAAFAGGAVGWFTTTPHHLDVAAASALMGLMAAVPIYFGLVYAVQLVLAPVRIHQEQQVERRVAAVQELRSAARSFLAMALKRGNTILRTIQLATIMEEQDAQDRAKSLKQVREAAIPDPETIEVLESVMKAEANGAADILLRVTSEYRDEVRKALGDLPMFDDHYVALFDSESGLVPPPPDVRGVYGPFARSIHYRCLRIGQFIKDFHDV